MARMELPVIDKFCFVFNLRTGCIAMGIINSILTLILLIILITFAIDIKDSADAAALVKKLDEREEGAVPSVVYTIVVLLVILQCIKLVFDLVFIYGVHREKSSILKKYCIFWMVFLVLYVIGFLKSLFHIDAGHVIAQLLYLAENFYFLVVIRSYLISINEDGVL